MALFGFVGFLASSGDLSFANFKRAVVYGSATASFCVEQFGIERVKSLTRDELNQRIQVFRDLTDVNF